MAANSTHWTKTAHGVRRTTKGTTIELIAYGHTCVRVSVWGGQDARLPSLAVIASPELPADATWTVAGPTAQFESRAGRIVVGEDGSVRAETLRGDVLFTETAAERLTGSGDCNQLKAGAPVAATFQIPADTGLYGLGQFQDGLMDRRGSTVELVQGNMVVIVPFLVTGQGWGLLWDQAGPGRFADGPGGTRFTAVSGRAVDYVICFGARIDDAIAGYRHLTGRAALLPKWAFGYWQSRERYKTAAELAGTVAEFRRRHFPLDVIVQDWEYWGDRPQWSAMVHNPAHYGDLPGAIRQIHEHHARVAISIWPVVGPETAVAQELKAAGHLFETVHWSTGHLYDAFSAEARAIYWKHARQGLWDAGVDGWWMDATEPEFGDPFCGGTNALSLQAEPKQPVRGAWAEVMNAYSLETTRGFWENQRATTRARRVCILTRSGWAGQQRYGAITWSGDISASWPVFRAQVAAGLQFALAGIPYWTTDIGGFFTGFRSAPFPNGVADPAYRELYVRWFQYAAFCPIFRSHGTQTPREPWQFGGPGDATYDTLQKFARLRYRLLPYFYTLAGQAYHRHGTPLRALVMDFPDDPRCRAEGEEFLCGPALLVAPQLDPLEHAPHEPLPIVPPDALMLPDGIRGRILVRHRRGRDGREEVYADKAMSLDFNWNESPPQGLSETDYQICAEGFLVALETGAHELAVRADGDVRMVLDGRTVIDARGDATARLHRAEVNLLHGRPVRFELVYTHGAGKGTLQVGWFPPRQRQLPPIGQRRHERRVYLPRGGWHDFWTGEHLAGSRDVVRPAPLDSLPLLVRAGSVLPLGPDLEWTDQHPADPLEVRVYPGADGAGEWYEDAGDGFDYETGAWSVVPWRWSDRDGVLTLGARQGTYAGQPASRRLRVVRVRPGVGVGIDPAPTVDREVCYDGRELQITLS